MFSKEKRLTCIEILNKMITNQLNSKMEEQKSKMWKKESSTTHFKRITMFQEILIIKLHMSFLGSVSRKTNRTCKVSNENTFYWYQIIPTLNILSTLMFQVCINFNVSSLEFIKDSYIHGECSLKSVLWMFVKTAVIVDPHFSGILFITKKEIIIYMRKFIAHFAVGNGVFPKQLVDVKKKKKTACVGVCSLNYIRLLFDVQSCKIHRIYNKNRKKLFYLLTCAVFNLCIIRDSICDVFLTHAWTK